MCTLHQKGFKSRSEHRLKQVKPRSLRRAPVALPLYVLCAKALTRNVGRKPQRRHRFPRARLEVLRKIAEVMGAWACARICRQGFPTARREPRRSLAVSKDLASSLYTPPYLGLAPARLGPRVKAQAAACQTRRYSGALFGSWVVGMIGGEQLIMAPASLTAPHLEQPLRAARPHGSDDGRAHSRRKHHVPTVPHMRMVASSGWGCMSR